MINKIVDVFKEVFWLKPRPKKRAPARKKAAKKSPAKKKPVKKTVKQPPAEKKKAVKIVPAIDPDLEEVGAITHYFDRIKVCVVKLARGTILIGDKLTIMGPKTKFVQKVWSMQIESVDVKVAKKGQLIGLKVEKLVAVGDKVYK